MLSFSPKVNAGQVNIAALFGSQALVRGHRFVMQRVLGTYAGGIAPVYFSGGKTRTSGEKNSSDRIFVGVAVVMEIHVLINLALNVCESFFSLFPINTSSH